MRKKTTSRVESAVSIVTNRTAKCKVINIRVAGNYVSFQTTTKFVLYAKERDDSGSVKQDSEIAARETKWFTIDARDMRRNAVALGIVRLLLINHNKIDAVLISAFLNAFVTVKITPFAEGDEFIARDGSTLIHEHNGQTVELIAADLDVNSVREAKEDILMFNASK